MNPGESYTFQATGLSFYLSITKPNIYHVVHVVSPFLQKPTLIGTTAINYYLTHEKYNLQRPFSLHRHMAYTNVDRYPGSLNNHPNLISKSNLALLVFFWVIH